MIKKKEKEEKIRNIQRKKYFIFINVKLDKVNYIF